MFSEPSASRCRRSIPLLSMPVTSCIARGVLTAKLVISFFTACCVPALSSMDSVVIPKPDSFAILALLYEPYRYLDCLDAIAELIDKMVLRCRDIIYIVDVAFPGRELVQPVTRFVLTFHLFAGCEPHLYPRRY